MGTIALSEFTAGLQYDLPGVPQPLLNSTARRVVQEFCRHTQLWQEDLGPITINAFQSDYPLSYDDGFGQSGSVEGVLNVEVDGSWVPPLLSQSAYASDPRWRHSTNDASPFRWLTRTAGILTITPVPRINKVGATGGPQDNAWVGGMAYTLNTTIYDTAGFQQTCTTAGTSGSTVPTWDDNEGGTTTDGTVTWTYSGPEPYVNPTGINVCEVLLQPDNAATTFTDALDPWVPYIQDGIRFNLKGYLKPGLRDPAIMQFNNRYIRGKNECRIKTIGEQGSKSQTIQVRFPGSI